MLLKACTTAATTAVLLAQIDPIAGATGWVGAGLLGLVLAWLLLKHLPDKDKQMERFMEDRTKIVTDLTNNFTAELGRRDSTIQQLAEAFRQEAREARHDARDALQTILNQAAAQNKALAVAMKADFEALAQRLTTAGGKDAGAGR